MKRASVNAGHPKGAPHYFLIEIMKDDERHGPASVLATGEIVVADPDAKRFDRRSITLFKAKSTATTACHAGAEFDHKKAMADRAAGKKRDIFNTTTWTYRIVPMGFYEAHTIQGKRGQKGGVAKHERLGPGRRKVRKPLTSSGYVPSEEGEYD
jgi:hypothetical protein